MSAPSFKFTPGVHLSGCEFGRSHGTAPLVKGVESVSSSNAVRVQLPNEEMENDTRAMPLVSFCIIYGAFAARRSA